jgi:c-di-GMP-binding flagellar brake protein YcgR
MSVGNRSLDLDGVVITADKETQEGPSVFRNGIRFTHINPEDQSLLIKYSFEYSIPKFMETYAQPNTLFNQLEDFLRQDQRRKRRWTFSLPTKLRFNQQIGEKEILAVTEDISEGGLSIVSSEELPLGILLNFSIELSDQQIQGKGRTSRGESHPFGHFQIYRYVIQFHQLENRDLAQIRQIKTLVSMAQGN